MQIGTENKEKRFDVSQVNVAATLVFAINPIQGEFLIVAYYPRCLSPPMFFLFFGRPQG